MDRHELPELHYITASENVPSILVHGLLSHQRARRVPHRSVALQAIQDRRAPKRIPGGRALHEYVNLYINGRNPMLFRVLGGTPLDDICLLRVAPTVLDVPGTVIADGNASSDYVRFPDAPGGLALIDHETVFAEYWTHPGDQIATWRHKFAMCAEVLVPDRVEPSLMVGAYVGSHAARQRLCAAAPALLVTLDAYKFFR